MDYAHYWDNLLLYSRREDGRFDVHRPYRISKRIYPYKAEVGKLSPEASPVQATLRRLGITVPGGERGLRSAALTDIPNEDNYWEVAQEQERRVLGTLPGHWENERAVAEFQRD